MDIQLVDSRNTMMALMPKNMIIAELGVFCADFSRIILKNANPKELHLCDLWEGDMMSADKDGTNWVKVNDMNKMYEGLCNEFSANNNVKLYKMDTTTMLNLFPDNYFDLIYIDADHSYQGVYNDLNLALKKSKKYIAGHDYFINFNGVIRAVNQFCLENNVHMIAGTQDGCPSYLIDIENIK